MKKRLLAGWTALGGGQIFKQNLVPTFLTIYRSQILALRMEWDRLHAHALKQNAMRARKKFSGIGSHGVIILRSLLFSQHERRWLCTTDALAAAREVWRCVLLLHICVLCARARVCVE